MVFSEEKKNSQKKPLRAAKKMKKIIKIKEITMIFLVIFSMHALFSWACWAGLFPGAHLAQLFYALMALEGVLFGASWAIIEAICHFQEIYLEEKQRGRLTASLIAAAMGSVVGSSLMVPASQVLTSGGDTGFMAANFFGGSFMCLVGVLSFMVSILICGLFGWLYGLAENLLERLKPFGKKILCRLRLVKQ